VKEYSNLLEFLLTSVKEQLRKIGYFQITVKEDAPHAPPPPPPLLVPALEPMEPLLLPVKLPPPQLTIEVKVPEVRMLPPHTCEKAVKVAPAQSKPQPPTPAVTHHQDGDPFRCEACRLIGLWERNRRQLLDARSARGPKPWIGAWAVKPDSYAVPVTASSLPELLPLEWPGSSSDTPWLPNRTFIDCPFTEYDSEWDDPDRLRVFHDDNEPWLEKWRQHQYKDPWLPAGCAKLPNEFYYVCDPWHRATEQVERVVQSHSICLAPSGDYLFTLVSLQAPFFRSRSSGHCEEPPSIIGGKTIVLDADRHLVDSRPHTADHTRGNSQCNFKRPSYQPEPLFTYHDHRLAEPSNAVALQTPEQTTINLSAEFAESLHPGLNRDSSSIRQDPPLALSSSFRASPSKLLVSPAKRFGKHPPSGAQQSSLGRRKNTGLPLNLKLKNLKSPFEDVSGPGNRPGLISVSSELLFQSRDTMDQPERTGLASESARLNTTLKDSAESTSTFWTMSLIPQLEPLVAHRESSVIGSSISDDSLKVATGGLSLRHHEESDAWLRSITLRPVLSTSTMSSAIPTAQHAIVHSPVRLRKKTHKPGIGVKSKLKALLSTSKPKKTRSNLKLMPTLSAKVAPL
jgi:hypothetical protein